MKSKKSVYALYRQGDVAIERIASLPASLKPVALESGKVILAHGEVTGHHHAFAATDCEKFTDSTGAEFFKVKGQPLNLTLPLVRQWKGQVMVNHSELGLIEFSENDVEVRNGMVIATGNFGLLKHDEHNAHGIPAGIYKGAGASGTVRQREYSPEAIRNVMD